MQSCVPFLDSLAGERLSTTGPFLRPHTKNCKQRTQDVRLNSSQNLLHSGFCSIKLNQKSSYFQCDGKSSSFQCDEKRVSRVPTSNVTKSVASIPSFNVTKIEFQEFLLSMWSKESPKEFVVSTWPKELQEFQESYFHSGISSSSYDRPKSAICWVSSRELKRTSESRGHLYEKKHLSESRSLQRSSTPKKDTHSPPTNKTGAQCQKTQDSN